MKKIIFLLSFLTIGISANAQKCKYDIDKTDPFSKKPLKAIKMKLNNAFNRMTISKEGTDYKLALTIFKGGESSEVISQKDSLKILLDDGSIVKFAPIISSYIHHQQGASQGVAYTNYTINYKISEKEIEQLKKAIPTTFRLKIGAIEQTFEVKSKKGKEIQHAAGCIQ